jgi:hypothetical protein
LAALLELSAQRFDVDLRGRFGGHEQKGASDRHRGGVSRERTSRDGAEPVKNDADSMNEEHSSARASFAPLSDPREAFFSAANFPVWGRM